MCLNRTTSVSPQRAVLMLSLILTFPFLAVRPSSPMAALSRPATGPSYAEIKIIPLALNRDGALLCKTYYYVNRTGAHSLQRAEFGWLVVSARGMWEEIPHAVVDPDVIPYEQAQAQMDNYRAEFERRFNWASPPSSVRPILTRYGFRNQRGFNPRAGAGTLTLTPTQLCARGRCARRQVVQRSLHDLHSERGGDGAPVRASFHRAGITLFRNVQEFDERGVDFTTRGADFFIPTFLAPEDPGVDLWTIDAILITSGNARSNAGSRTRSRVRD